MPRLEAILYGHWVIPLLSSGKVHSLDSDWLLVHWMGILVCVYTGLLNMLQVRYLVTAHFIFCLPAEAVEPVSVVIVFNWNHFEMRLLNLRINFYLLRTFVLILVDFFLCVCVCCFFFHYVSAKFHLWPSSGDLARTMPVAQRIEALSSNGSRWALSEDSGFRSYPSRPEVYFVKNVVR